MKKTLLKVFLTVAITVNAQSYEQSHRNWDIDTIPTLQQVLDYGVEFNQRGDSVYSIEIKDTELKLVGTINRISNKQD
jgi:hypothetical protein